jgi:ABC-type lipoprotein export system ATPase subunit
MPAVLSCEEVWCRRDNWRGAGASSVVRGVSADFRGGELCGFVGEDGCGKGLLLNILGMLESPDNGSVTAASGEIPESARREKTFGYLFTQTGLLPGLTVCENVAMPLFRIRGVPLEEAGDITRRVMETCGCGEVAETPAGELDSLTAARAALARALAHNPKILVVIAPQAEEAILPLAARIAQEGDLCILWAGQHKHLALHAHRLITMHRGEISSDTGP